MKKPLKIILIILAVLVGLVAALLIWLTATQLNVKTETAVVTNGENSTASFAPGDSVSILTWNVGYAGLGEESDRQHREGAGRRLHVPAGDRGRPLDPLLRH